MPNALERHSTHDTVGSGAANARRRRETTDRDQGELNNIPTKQ
jgi:hypothetical protein